MALPPITDADHARGPSAEDAAVTLVLYGDFECPYSQSVQAIVNEVRDAHPDRVRFVFRHFPIRYHPYALGAAVASEAVAAQGLFWPFHDRLYEHQLALRPPQLVAHAEAVGAEGAAVQAALADETRQTAVLAQKRGGVRAGVRSTLNLWIDGTLFEEDDLETAFVTHVIQPLQAGGA